MKNILDFGSIINRIFEDGLYIMTVIFMKASGKKTKQMESAFIFIQMVPGIVENGRTTNSMVKELKPGL